MERLRKRLIRRISPYLICLLLCPLLCGCSKDDLQGYLKKLPFVGKGNVFRMETMRCSEAEAKIYLHTYAAVYGDLYGLDLWTMDFSEQSPEEYVRNVSLTELTRIYCMNLLAEEKGIVLSEEETEKVTDAARAYYDTLSTDDVAYLNAAEEEILEAVKHYALAQKVYQVLTEPVNTEISDNEARVMKVQQIVLDSEAAAQEVLSKLDAGAEFSSLLSYNTEADSDLYITRDSYPDLLSDRIYQMDDNEVSDLLQAEGKWYLIRILNKYEEDRTEENKAVILEERRRALFDESYDPFAEQVEFQMQENIWDSLAVIHTKECEQNFFAICSSVFMD